MKNVLANFLSNSWKIATKKRAYKYDCIKAYRGVGGIWFCLNYNKWALKLRQWLRPYMGYNTIE